MWEKEDFVSSLVFAFASKEPEFALRGKRHGL